MLYFILVWKNFFLILLFQDKLGGDDGW